jgi:hypothetical protein
MTEPEVFLDAELETLSKQVGKGKKILKIGKQPRTNVTPKQKLSPNTNTTSESSTNLPAKITEEPKKEIKASGKQKAFALIALKGFAESQTLEEIGRLAGMKESKSLRQRVYHRLQAAGVKAILAEFVKEVSIDKPDIEALFTKWAYDDDPNGKQDPRFRMSSIASAKELAHLKGHYPDSRGGTQREIIYWKELIGMAPNQVREVAKALHQLVQGKTEEAVDASFEEVPERQNSPSHVNDLSETVSEEEGESNEAPSV